MCDPIDTKSLSSTKQSRTPLPMSPPSARLAAEPADPIQPVSGVPGRSASRQGLLHHPLPVRVWRDRMVRWT